MDAGLVDVARRLAAGTGPIAVDAERASGYRYSARAYLVQIATRQALNRLRTQARRREEYVGEWLPEPLVTDRSMDPAEHAELPPRGVLETPPEFAPAPSANGAGPGLELLVRPGLELSAQGVNAQARPDARFTHLTTADGLSQSEVTGIVQDARGFLWIATTDGLNRYDGYTFTVYTHDPDDPNTPGGNYLHTLLQDRDGQVGALGYPERAAPVLHGRALH